mgnify:CR=1 FL=1
MPFGDRTGPGGWGPRTGRGAGLCSGYPVPGFLNRGWGGGWFRPGTGWFGGGRGWRHWFYATGLPGWLRSGAPGWCRWWFPSAEAPSREQEAEFLRQQAKWLENALTSIRKRLDNLETQGGTE